MLHSSIGMLLSCAFLCPFIDFNSIFWNVRNVCATFNTGIQLNIVFVSFQYILMVSNVSKRQPRMWKIAWTKCRLEWLIWQQDKSSLEWTKQHFSKNIAREWSFNIWVSIIIFDIYFFSFCNLWKKYLTLFLLLVLVFFYFFVFILLLLSSLSLFCII